MQTLQVDGMTCSHCERAVTAALKAIDPGATVQVSLASGTVTTNSAFPAEALAKAIRGAGYEVSSAHQAQP